MDFDVLSFRFREPAHDALGQTAYCFDILVSGKPLTDFFPRYRRFVTPFALGYKTLADQLGPINEYMGKSSPQSKLGVPFLICPECHDEACGGIWGAIEFAGNYVKWHDFFENDSVFIFEKEAYSMALESLGQEIAQMHAAGTI